MKKINVICSMKDCENYIPNENSDEYLSSCKRDIIAIYPKGNCGYYYKKE